MIDEVVKYKHKLIISSNREETGYSHEKDCKNTNCYIGILMKSNVLHFDINLSDTL